MTFFYSTNECGGGPIDHEIDNIAFNADLEKTDQIFIFNMFKVLQLREATRMQNEKLHNGKKLRSLLNGTWNEKITKPFFNTNGI